MKRLITHDGSAYRTGDEIADAVCHYSRVLTRVGTIDIVDIPVVVGVVTQRARLTIGWRAGVVAVSSHLDGEETEDIATVLELYTRAARVLPHGREFNDDDIDRMQWPEM